MDDLNILLGAQIDINKSIKNINTQITQLEGRLKNINISLDISNIKDIFRDIENVAVQTSKTAKNNMNDELRLAQEIAKVREKSEIKSQNRDRQQELNQAKAINKALEGQAKLEKDISIWKDRQNINIDKLATKENVDISGLNKLRSSLEKISVESVDARSEMKDFNNELTRVNATARNSSDSILKTAMSYFTLYDAFQLGKRAISSVIDSVKELDTELTNLAKVTDLNSVQLDDMTKRAFELGNEIGRTGSEVVSSMALFAQAGYSENELADLARASLLYQNVADSVMSEEESVGYVVAALKAFNLESSKAVDIGSAINSVSNKNAVGFENLADGLARTSSVFAQADTDISSLLGLLSGGYEISRDMEKTASGLITISTRLRSVQLEGEEAVMPIAKLQETFKNMANVDIIDPVTKELRGTYDILESLYEAWGSLNSLQQESIAFAAAGTRQKSVFLNLMSNFDGVKKAADDATNSIGSMDQENSRFLDSINGRMQLLSSSWSNMSNNFISSDLIKSIVDFGTHAINTVDSIGVLNVGLITLAGTMAAVGKIKNISWLTSLPSLLGAATTGVTTLTGALLTNPLFLGAVGIVGAIKMLDLLTVSLDEQKENVKELEEGYNSLVSELESLRSIENPTEANERKIALLERELELQEKILNIEIEKLVNKQFNSDINSMASNVEALETSIDLFKRKQDEILETGGDASKFATLESREADLAKYASKANETLTSLTSNYDRFNEEQKKQADEMMENAESVLMLSDELLGLDGSVNTVNDAVTSLNETIEVNKVEQLADSFASFQEEAEESSDKIKLLNETINSLDEKQVLVGDSIVELLKKFPQLRNDVEKTGDTFTINRDALVELRDQSIDTFNTMAGNQRDAINEAAEGARIRISNYRTEINELRKLATAQSAMYAISNSNKQLMGYEGLNTDTQSDKLIFEKEKALLLDNGYKQAQQDLQTYLKMLDDLSNSEQDQLIRGNEANTKKGSNISSKKAKEDKAEYEKYFSQLIDEKVSIILSESKRLEEAIAFAEEKLTQAELKGNTEQQETLKKQLLEYTKQRRDLTASTAEELRQIGTDARIQLGSMKIEGYADFDFSKMTELDVAQITQSYDRAMIGVSDATKASIEKQKSKFEELSSIVTRIYGDELPQLSKDWHGYETELIQQQIDLLELKKEILSEPLSDMELEISQHENKIKLLELENAIMEDQVSAYNSLLDSETLREEYLKLTIDDLYKQRDLLDSTSKQYKTLTQYILDFESQLTDSLQSQANAKEKLIDMAYKELETSLEKSIYGNRGQKGWEKLNNKKIDRLNDELDLLKKQSDEKQKQADAEKRALEMAELRTKLENAKKQKTVQEFKKDEKTGQWQWNYTYDAQVVSDLEKQIRDKQLEEEKRVEDEKQAKKEQGLRDEISRLQKESQAKSEFFNQSKEDLLQYLQENKDSLTINGEEVLGIVTDNMTGINNEFDTKMTLISDSLRDKLAEIKAMFNDALSMESSMGSMGGGNSSGSGGKTYSNKGASGKVYYQQSDGNIIVDRPDGTSSTVKPSDKNYSSTVSAMEKDKVNKKYKEGGTTDETGWHWLDGEPGVPERVLSARQTAAFELGMENIPRFNFEVARMLGRMEEVNPISRMSNAVVNNSSTPTLHIDKVEMHEVNNVKDMARAIRDELPGAFAGLIAKSKLVPSGE